MPLVIFPAILRLWKYSARIIKTIEIIAVKGNEILFPAGADLIPVGIVAVGNLGGRFIFSAFFRDNIHNAAHRFSAIQNGAWSLDDFNFLHRINRDAAR